MTTVGGGGGYKIDSIKYKSSLKSLGYIYNNSQNTPSFMPKIIRILRSCSMKIFCTFTTINISVLNF